MGPGDAAHLSQRAREVLTGADVIAGYGTYIDLIRPLVANKAIISTGMTREVERVAAAIDAACLGKSVALVSSGDPGIYAMAGLALEMCEARRVAAVPSWTAANGDSDETGSLRVEVVPGIPALCAGAALLGAPLMHDFCAISLSDLLTPWEVIETRLDAAARADFVMVLYNPKSKKRHWQLEKARQIMMNHKPAQTPVGVVTGAMRSDQRIQVTTLEELHTAMVNMQSTVFIGNHSTRRYGDFLLTLRGYGEKYRL
ncbi:precorrin-3B C(17)-methyltransferase [Desulfosarcina widdelii]|nr:precorrin-3B C(17)-methyltransferase [Desulfosarcina widdelii]